MEHTKENIKQALLDKVWYDDYLNLIQNHSKIDSNGNYEIEVGFPFNFNINDIVNELLEKANQFDDNQKVKCFGRTLTVI